MISDASANLSQLRAVHNSLMRETLKSESIASRVSDIEDLMTKLAALGTDLSTEDDRASAQNILDYWSASLADVGEGRRPRRAVRLKEFAARSASFSAVAPAQGAQSNPFQNINLVRRADGARLPGREDAIHTVLDLLDQHGIVFVIGPAGSGRSALVNAGVLWQLETSERPRPIFRLATPGHDPIARLAEIVPGADAKHLEERPSDFSASFHAACGGEAGILSIDNAEELFTECADKNAREAFALAIASLVPADRSSRQGVIVVLREEWDEQTSALKGFSSIPREARFRPAPPTAAELQRMIDIPAQAAGMTFEKGIVQDLARELQGDMAALPLVQFMLSRLWSLSVGGRVDWTVYQSAGRPQDALGRVATETYAALTVAGKDAARRLILALAVPRQGEAEQGVVARSHRASRREITKNEQDAAMVEALDAFLRAGLIRTSSFESAKDDSIEIIHDSLLHRWNTAVEWLVDEKRRLETGLEVLNSARLWDKAGRPDGLLLANWELVKKSKSFFDAELQYSSFSEADQAVLASYIALSESYLTAYDRRERQLRYLRNALLPLGISVAVFFALFYSDLYTPDWFSTRNPVNRKTVLNYAIVSIKNPDQRPYHRLMFKVLGGLQYLTSLEINLSPARIQEIDLSEINLFAPNFDGSPIVDTVLTGASLPNATFHGATLQNVNLDGATLRNVQFQESVFENGTSFRGADLSGATFDRTQLCDVDFSEAGLENVTFWGASFPTQKEKFLANFRNAPWWLASGWTRLHLSYLQGSSFSAATIANGNPFRNQLKQYEDRLGTASDDFARAVGNNNLAWMLAIWGVCIQQSCDGVPDAENNANVAVGLMQKLLKQADASDKGLIGNLNQKLATMLDTRGYIRLQKGKLNEAEEDFVYAVNATAPSTGADILFHYSIALKALKKEPKATQILLLSLREGHRPSHELQHLWAYLQTVPGQTESGYENILKRRIRSLSRQALPIKLCGSNAPSVNPVDQ